MLINSLRLLYDAGLKIGLLDDDAATCRIFSGADHHVSLFRITEPKEALL